MGYPPGEHGYRVRSIAAHHFFTSGNVIFDENIPYHSIYFIPTSTQDYSGLPFLDQHDSETSNIPAVPTLPPNPSNLDDLDTMQLPHLGMEDLPPPIVPTMPPPSHSQVHLAPITPNPVHMHLRDQSKSWQLTEKGKIFEKDIEAAKSHLAKVREAVEKRGHVRGRSGGGESDRGEMRGVDRGGGEDENPFTALCNSRVLNEYLCKPNMDSVTLAASLDADEYFQHDVDSFCEATLLSICSDVWQNPLAEGYDMSIPPATYWEAERQMDAAEWQKVTEKELGDLKRMEVYEDVEVEELPEGKKAIGCQWVYEFKQSESGGPPIYKAHLDSCCPGVLSGALHGLWGDVCTCCEVSHGSFRHCILCATWVASSMC